MKILAIETSCDETSAAVVEAEKGSGSVSVLANITATSLTQHAITGGIIPEVAARKQVEFIEPVIQEVLQKAGLDDKKPTIDGIAVTYGPGLIGSLLVGVETAKTLAYAWNKPLIPVNHLYGHMYANFIAEKNEQKNISFPALALIVSGGHTDLVLIKKHRDILWLGGTRDDAAGEAMDKIGRLIGLPYPGGPAIEEKAKKGNEKAFIFPRALMGSDNFDFSFSGLKTAALREVTRLRHPEQSEGSNELPEQIVNDIAAAVQKAIIAVLVKKTILAAEKYQVKSILLGGGVAANQKLREELQKGITSMQMQTKLYAPPLIYCTDNAAMIGAAAFFNYQEVKWNELNANPELYFD